MGKKKKEKVLLESVSFPKELNPEMAISLLCQGYKGVVIWKKALAPQIIEAHNARKKA